MKTAMSENKRVFAAGKSESLIEEVKHFFEGGMGIIMAMGLLISLWSLTCLISAVVRFGPLEVLRGWLSAISGS